MPLLGDDADEEMRMAAGLQEKTEHTVDGKAKRVSYDDLRVSQRIAPEEEEDEIDLKEEDDEIDLR